jgi:hypothetical protein
MWKGGFWFMPYEVICKRCAFIVFAENKKDALNELMYQHFLFSHGYEPCEKDAVINRITNAEYKKLRWLESNGLIHLVKKLK